MNAGRSPSVGEPSEDSVQAIGSAQALLIIDMQQGLCAGPNAAFDSAQVVDRINRMAHDARAVGITVVFIQHETRGGALDHGTADWQIADGLDHFQTDRYVRKRTPDAFHETELSQVLTGLGVGTLVICGLQSEFCVDTTTRRALAMGYPVVLVADAHSTVDNGLLQAAQISAHHNTTLANISSFGPRVTLVASHQLRFGNTFPSAPPPADPLMPPLLAEADHPRSDADR